jgi:hypothetical protein
LVLSFGLLDYSIIRLRINWIVGLLFFLNTQIEHGHFE